MENVSGYIPDWRDEEENEPRVNGTFPECTCSTSNPALYEGPAPWCDVHGQPSVAYDRGFAAGRQAEKLLLEAGFEPKSVANAVESENLSLLEHPGRYAVKLDSVNGVTPENRERAARYIYRSRAPIGEPRDEWERMKDGSTRKKTYLRAADEIVKLYMGWDQ